MNEQPVFSLKQMSEFFQNNYAFELTLEKKASIKQSKRLTCNVCMHGLYNGRRYMSIHLRLSFYSVNLAVSMRGSSITAGLTARIYRPGFPVKADIPGCVVYLYCRQGTRRGSPSREPVSECLVLLTTK